MGEGAMGSSKRLIDNANGRHEAASLQTMEALLEEAVHLADTLQLDFAAIRIEEALSLVRSHAADNGISVRN
ncbi:hypothetical protein [Sphingomonas sp. CLY1604]|uniref:hypothetical protein n=1 Tax=Sphingomonas sp. CLY1604 TaxID=3457786 RepID=UPI003FD6E65D